MGGLAIDGENRDAIDCHGSNPPGGIPPYAWAAVAADLCSLGLQNKCVLHCGLHA